MNYIETLHSSCCVCMNYTETLFHVGLAAPSEEKITLTQILTAAEGRIVSKTLLTKPHVESFTEKI